MKSTNPPGGLREVLAIALPMVIGNSAFTVMQFCDRLFLAWHSDLAIQAAMPAGLLSFALVCLFTAIAGYSSTFVSQYHGAKEEANSVHAAAQGLIFMLLSTPVLLLMIPLGSRMFAWFGHAQADVGAYLQATRQNKLQYHTATVRLQLQHVFACVAVRRFKP